MSLSQIVAEPDIALVLLLHLGYDGRMALSNTAPFYKESIAALLHSSATKVLKRFTGSENASLGLLRVLTKVDGVILGSVALVALGVLAGSDPHSLDIAVPLNRETRVERVLRSLNFKTRLAYVHPERVNTVARLSSFFKAPGRTINIVICKARSVWPHILSAPTTNHAVFLTSSHVFALYPEMTLNRLALCRSTSFVGVLDDNADYRKALRQGFEVATHNNRQLPTPLHFCPGIIRRLRGEQNIYGLRLAEGDLYEIDRIAQGWDLQRTAAIAPVNIPNSLEPPMANAPWYTLPPELVSAVCDNLEVVELVRLSRVNRRCRAFAGAALNKFTPNALLRRWFSAAEIDDFRRLQAVDGILISGSTALAFLTRNSFHPGDLDCYVPYYRSFRLLDFLRQSGYALASDNLPRGGLATHVLRRAKVAAEWAFSYSNPEIRSVYTFVRGSGSSAEKIQVIVTAGSPVHAILHFHSTCVMNFIAHNYAACLFPKATLVDRVTIPLGGEKHSLDNRKLVKWNSAVAKYEARGWTVVEPEDFAISEALGRTCYSIFTRRVGDVFSLVWEFESTWDKSIPSPASLDITKAHSWDWEYEGKHAELSTTNLRTADGVDYCVVPTIFFALQRKANSRLSLKARDVYCTSREVEHLASSFQTRINPVLATIQEWIACNPMPEGYICYPTAAAASELSFTLNHMTACIVDVLPEISCSWKEVDGDLHLLVTFLCKGYAWFNWSKLFALNSTMIGELRDMFVSLELGA
ncbi:hypothetical protein VNI00_003693 [Paramarasmius palmivorus]|uniref:F-box domain-containing protein n=1 Tax=Paramarasmius palmivorus TaxID=297713 RepID=A0AAW0DTQ3_9AGAR